MIETILPDGWQRPRGYSNGILTQGGKTLYMAGQVGWDPVQEVFPSDKLVPQFEQTLKNIVAVLGRAGGKPEHIVKMTCFCKDKKAYLEGRKEIGLVWLNIIGKNFPCMSMIFIDDLLAHPSLIEIEATAVIPE